MAAYYKKIIWGNYWPHNVTLGVIGPAFTPKEEAFGKVITSTIAKGIYQKAVFLPATGAEYEAFWAGEAKKEAPRSVPENRHCRKRQK